MKSLFTVNVKLPTEYKDWVNEMVRTFVLLTTIHVLQYMTKSVGTGNPRGLFNVHFWKLLVFALIGFSAYFLVVKKLIRFRHIDDLDVEDDGQSPTSLAFSPFDMIARLREWLKSKL